jgi:tetratricopeptide (TPR) repeat protein
VTVEETQPSRLTAALEAADGPSEAPQGKPGVGLRPFLLWGLGFVLLLVLSVGAGAYLGIRRGEQERIRRLEREVERHYATGLQHLDDGSYQLAEAEFDYVLRLDPGHSGAEQGLAEVEARVNADPTPTKKPEEPIAEQLYREALSHYEAERWQEAASVLTTLRQLDPDHEPEQVEAMLFESRYEAGMALLEEGDFELGIFYLDRAVALRPLDEEASEERRLAKKYVEALSYWGADWEETIAHFEELYRTAPQYRDVFQRLYQAHVRYARAWERQGEMCPAAEQYEQALRLMNSAETEARHTEAVEVCRNATPTPVPTIEGSRPLTQTALPPGFNAGRLAYPLYDTASGTWDVYALFADGRLLQMVSNADQPVWMWNSDALGYRDRLSPGISLLPSLQAPPQQLAAGASLAWPTFSPDGRRMAYASPDQAGVWQIFLRPTDGSAEPQPHAAGWGPAWGPSGLLAWTGCEPDNGEACGIFIDNPDDDQPATRVSGSGNDIALSWSPGGNQLAYMSDHTGNWEVYIYNLGGGFQVLTDHPASDGLPVWSPDGSAIAFVSNRDGAWSIYLMQPGGEDPRQVISLGPNYPNWTQQRLSWAP